MARARRSESTKTPRPSARSAAAAAPVALADEGDHRLGENVRLLRQRAGLSIHEVAQRAGLSNGMISQLERGLTTPSVRTLRMLSIALDVPISYFFEPSAAGGSQRYVVRKGARRLLRLTANGVLKEALTPVEPGELELYELTLNPGASSGTDFLSHSGEKAGFVLAGSMRLWLDHEAHLLDAGDSFRFPSELPHMFDNPTQQATRVIWVTTLRRKQTPAAGR